MNDGCLRLPVLYLSKQDQMNVNERLGSIAKNHPDANLLGKFRELVNGLWMYSEDRQPYDVFLWEVAKHGEISRDPALFDFMQVIEKVHGTKSVIRKSSLLQEKHRVFFEFDGNNLAKKKPSKFFKNRYDAFNRFLGRIYTDNGALEQEEILQMRTLAKQVWQLEPNTVRVFEFDSPVIQQYLMGRTENGNWLGIHTIAVET